MTWFAGYASETAFSKEGAISYRTWTEARDAIAKELKTRSEALRLDLLNGAATGTERASLEALDEHLDMVMDCPPYRGFMIQTEGLIFYVDRERE